MVSVKESWLNGSPEIQDVLVAFAGWMAEQESARRSERIKAGLARRKSLRVSQSAVRSVAEGQGSQASPDRGIRQGVGAAKG